MMAIMPMTIAANRIMGLKAERVAIGALRTAGFEVTNLNDLASNFPLADLVARRGVDRLLVQVRGTALRHPWFRMAPTTPRAFGRLAVALGHHAVFAFVHVVGTWPTVRFGAADQVEEHILDYFFVGGDEGLSLDERGLVDICSIERLWAEDRDDLMLPDHLIG